MILRTKFKEKKLHSNLYNSKHSNHIYLSENNHPLSKNWVKGMNKKRKTDELKECKRENLIDSWYFYYVNDFLE